MRKIIHCLGVILSLITFINPVQAQNEQPQQVWIKPYRHGNHTFYTITQHQGGNWASMTGFKSHKPGSDPEIRWLAAGHAFPLSMKPEVKWISLNGKKAYINEIAPLGHDVCVFRLGEDSSYLVKGFSPYGPKEDYVAEMSVDLFDEGESLDKMFYLVDHQYYKKIGSIVIHEPAGDIEGSLIDFASVPGDCGTSFLLEEGFVYVIVKAVPAGMEMPDGRILGKMAVAIRIELHP